MRSIRSVPTVFTPSRDLEWHCAGTDALIAILLALPGKTFATGAIFDRFAAIMPESEWAVLIGGVAIVRIAALAINGHWRRTPLLRAITALIGATLHAYIAVLFWVPSVGAFGIGAAFSAALAVSDIRSAFRAGRDIVVAGRVFKMMQAAPPAPLPRSFAP
ncbi:hypothetical protein FV232_17115 [Methylobacterium sp. WL30]|uniref:hypothetical protein n=1 Tax=unclassified Methylobacterium TaxID=2615210 RepID=UPI0011C959F3|nr:MULTISPECIES: hypothetical protein [unclassified Methylobacterium]TXN41701.1 hypothetical protein FV225_01535 [Methylobacterium sp. WL93]TXN51061.1 hypothetical protein FV227_09615 [Methylobacterium sp. WL119]TXN65811.1 hypothetical protein FV232_17115 [Methylobacterium sp. WL30]